MEVRAALEAGAAPAAALAVARDGALAETARQLRLGRALSAVAADLGRGGVPRGAAASGGDAGDAGDAGAGDARAGDARAELLVRGLAVAERTGAGAVAAVDQVLLAAAETAAVTRLLAVRTTQARGTAVVLSVLPVAVWALLVLLDPATLRFYATPLGLGTAAGAAVLVLLARVLSLRLIRRVARAPERVDPLHGPPPERDPVRAVVLAVPVAVVLWMGVGAPLALVGGAAAALLGLRGRAEEDVDLRGGGTPETAELLAIALSAGLAPVAALAEVAELGPPAARPHLAEAARRLRAGWPLDDAFDGSPLAGVGAVLAATARWGSPAEPALRRLASELRADRCAAGEAAAERTQLALLFPTTLLTLPAFVLGVVPPVLWTAFGG